MDYELVEKTYGDGLALASIIRNMSSIDEANSISKKVDEYCVFLDDNYGINDEPDATKENESCELAPILYAAFDEKYKSLSDNNDVFCGNKNIDLFVEKLYSDYWLYDKILYEFSKIQLTKDDTKIKEFNHLLDDFLKKTEHLDDDLKESIFNITHK